MNRTTVPGLAGAQSAAALNGLKGLIDNLQTAGFIMHGALVDAPYVAQRSVTTGVQYSGEAMFVAPSDLPTALAKLVLCGPAYVNHIADGTHAHKAADVTNVLSAAVPTDLATGHVYAIALKNALNEHLAAPDYHASVVPFGSIFKVTKADSTDLFTLLLLTIDIQRVLRTHLFSAAPALVLQNA